MAQLVPWLRPGGGSAVPKPVMSMLTESRRRGLLGPGDLERHVAHAAGFAHGLPIDASVVDLGAGGGVPGLILAVACADLSFVLLDAAARRCRFLEWAVEEVGLDDRVEVVHGRAEDLSRSPSHRGLHDAVVARSFGPPAVTAECARGLLRPDGHLIVSEPPEATTADPRWPAGPLGELALAVGPRWTIPAGSFQRLDAIGVTPPSIPRRPGMPGRRPRY